MSTGLVWHDNHAHSAKKANIWIKENWVPRRDGSNHPLADDINIIDGFTTWKSPICVDIYGIGSVFFDHVYALDCEVAYNHEWQRRGESILSNSILIGESPNFGNVHVDGARTSTKSTIFPGVLKTTTSLGGLPRGLVRQSDGVTAIFNSVLINKTADEGQVRGSFHGRDYRGQEAGAFVHTNKFLQPTGVRPTSIEFENVEFNPPVYHAYVYDESGENEKPAIGPFYSPLPPTEDKLGPLHGAGFLDESGTWPCSAPGSVWLFNATDAPKDCVFVESMGMLRCPPLPDGHSYVQMRMTFEKQYQRISNDLVSRDVPSVMIDECNQELRPPTGGGHTQYFTLRTDKEYVFEPRDSNGDPLLPPGVTFRPILKDATDDWKYPGMTVVVKVPGKAVAEHFLIDTNDDLSRDSRIWNKQSAPDQECRCGFTFVRLQLRDVARGGAGDELRFEADESIECPSTVCSSPWPIPPPTTYACTDERQTVQDSFTTCSTSTLASYEALKLPPSPELPIYELDVELATGYGGIEVCAGRATPSCPAGGDFLEAACSAPAAPASPQSPDAPTPTLGGLTRCDTSSDCEAREECFAQNCVRRTVTCAPGAPGCRCDANDACADVENFECRALAGAANKVCVLKDADARVKANDVDPDDEGVIQLYPPVQGDEDGGMFTGAVAKDIGCVLGDAGCLCADGMCAGSSLACIENFCVEALDTAGELGSECIRGQCLGGELVCAQLANRQICVLPVKPEETTENAAARTTIAATVGILSAVAKL